MNPLRREHLSELYGLTQSPRPAPRSGSQHPRSPPPAPFWTPSITRLGGGAVGILTLPLNDLLLSVWVQFKLFTK